jgi:hypothetical protein
MKDNDTSQIKIHIPISSQTLWMGSRTVGFKWFLITYSRGEPSQNNNKENAA